MTILYCIPSLSKPGGMERVVTVKANWLADVAGHKVHIVTRVDGEPRFPLSSNVILHRIGSNYKKGLTDLLYSLRPAVAISLYGEESDWLYKIKDGSRKVIEFHFTRNHLVHLVQGLPDVRFRPLRLKYVRLLQFLDERCARYYDKMVLLTEGDRQLWGSPANAVVIPNPLSFTSPVCSDLRAKRIVTAGRLIATKGFDLLIEAFRLVAIQFPDWRLDIFGEGQDKIYLLNKIHRYGLDKQIEILRPTPDIAAELLNSSIYACSSRYEGFGLTITEAMECGVPAVAFDCECGPREIIEDGNDGLLIKPQNVDLFGRALQRLMASHEHRRRLGLHARESAQRFSVEAVMPRWEELFYSLTESKRIDVR
jgi:glycosyltransferase involved in cell wall biosynthesis